MTVQPVLGVGRPGILRVADVARRILEVPLAEAGLPSATPLELGLAVPGPAAPGPSAPGPDDRPGLARYLAVALRHPAVVIDTGKGQRQPLRRWFRPRSRSWAVAAPDGELARGGDPVRLCLDAARHHRPPRVAVFGGAWIQPQEPEYAEIRRLGVWLGERGVHLVCGGYQGAMAAACQGVAEAGGTAVGVTISEWADLVQVNRWLTHEVIARDLFARLPVITDAEAWVAYPGGVGTLQEVALCWNVVQTHLAEPRPLVLVGQEWGRQFHLFRELLRVSDPAHFDLVTLAASLPDVLEAIEDAVAG